MARPSKNEIRKKSLARLFLSKDQTPTVSTYLADILDKEASPGVTNAEAIAKKWLDMALEGNVVALKEILTRFAPIADESPQTIRYILERSPDGDWDRDTDDDDPLCA